MDAQHTSLQESLRQLRSDYGLSFHQLSERSHVDVAYLHRIETGQAVRPSRDVVIRIAIGLGLDIETTDMLLTDAGHISLLPVTRASRAATLAS